MRERILQRWASMYDVYRIFQPALCPNSAIIGPRDGLREKGIRLEAPRQRRAADTGGSFGLETAYLQLQVGVTGCSTHQHCNVLVCQCILLQIKRLQHDATCPQRICNQSHLKISTRRPQYWCSTQLQAHITIPITITITTMITGRTTMKAPPTIQIQECHAYKQSHQCTHP